MTYSLRIYTIWDPVPDNIKSNPIYWKKFKKSFMGDKLAYTFKEINNNLRNYNAIYRIDPKTNIRYIDFESEAHYSMFVLRWS